MSLAPPAAKVTTMRIGLSGQASAAGLIAANVQSNARAWRIGVFLKVCWTQQAKQMPGLKIQLPR